MINPLSNTRVIDGTNAEIDRKAKVAEFSEYLQSLGMPRAGPYWVRPDGTVEMMKHDVDDDVEPNPHL